MNPRLDRLQDYPFARLARLIADITPSTDYSPIALSIGEPRHPAPDFVVQALSQPERLREDLTAYPVTRGSAALREAIAAWINRRFACAADAERQVLPVNGTREALFAFAQAHVTEGLVGMPNPFYQIYEGAALLAGAEPFFINCDPANAYAQDFASIPSDVWQRMSLLYLCTPGNPTGQVMSEAELARLVELCLEHDVILASDECYSEIYPDEDNAPPSLLNGCIAAGNPKYRNCIIFHSLSKRSNLPGLRSGFVAGDQTLIESFLKYRTYHGCAMSHHHQHASTLAWSDEAHVVANRQAYREKFEAVTPILRQAYPVPNPQAGFYHWLPTPGADDAFAQALLERMNVKVLPGRFLARDTESGNPGTGHVRVAWVSEYANCVEGAERLRDFAQER